LLGNLKREVLEAAVAAEISGLCVHGTGNFSAIDRESGLVAITPSGLARESLTLEDVPLLDLRGGLAEPGKRGKPSSESRMHIEAYLRRKDVAAVAHTHSPYATALAVLGRTIEPVTFEAVFYGIDVAVVGLFRPGTEELAKAAAEALDGSDVCLLKNHGALVVGASVEETLLKAKHLESVARTYYLALTLGGDAARPIPREELERYGQIPSS
jgi:L-fuculose-phosphate aldolase